MKKLIALALVVLTGCSSFQTTPQSIENKAFAITQLVSSRVLQKHPDWKPQFIVARDDLKVLEASATVGLDQVLAIVNRLPQLQDGNVGLYINAGVLFFSDEIGQIAVKDPPQLRAAVTGMRRALDQALQ